MSDTSADHLDEGDPRLFEFRDWLHRNIGSIVAKYAGRVLWMIATVAFAAGVWATKLQLDLSALKEGQASAAAELAKVQTSIEAINVSTGLRVIEWSQWRVRKDAYDDNYERRLSWLETVERNRKP